MPKRYHASVTTTPLCTMSGGGSSLAAGHGFHEITDANNGNRIVGYVKSEYLADVMKSMNEPSPPPSLQLCGASHGCRNIVSDPSHAGLCPQCFVMGVRSPAVPLPPPAICNTVGCDGVATGNTPQTYRGPATSGLCRACAVEVESKARDIGTRETYPCLGTACKNRVTELDAPCSECNLPPEDEDEELPDDQRGLYGMPNQ